MSNMTRRWWFPFVCAGLGALVGFAVGEAIFRLRVWAGAYDGYAYFSGIPAALYEMFALRYLGTAAGAVTAVTWSKN